jgi:hypothetical protein
MDPAGGSTSVAMSLHELSVLPALKMEALAGREFTDVTVLGVEPGAVGWGQGLSAATAGAMEKLLDAVCHWLDERAAGNCLRAAAASGSKNE